VSNVLAIGAHPDDLELGCFGVLELHKRIGDKIFGLIITCGEKGGDPSQRRDEAKSSASVIDMDLAFGEYEDGYVPHDISLVSMIENFIVGHDIDIVYATSVHDRHQVVFDVGLAVLVAGRKAKEVYAYETISCTNDFHPTLYIDITKSMDVKRKCLEKHESQDHRTYIKNYESFNKYRSLKIDKPEKYHEVFEVIKIVR
jgi:LmbE family N-acetylglucosaminyl deacetylase